MQGKVASLNSFDSCLSKSKLAAILLFILFFTVLFITATEYHNCLLYYSLPHLKGILPNYYYQHYALLVGGITLLSGRSFSPGQLQLAGKFLIHFVEMFDVCYGK